MRTPRITSLALVTVALALGGCFKLARTSPPVERYVVGGAVPIVTPAVSSDSTDLSLGLRRLDLSPYLATLAIVVRRENNQIVTTGFHRWAEAPSTGLNRAVSGYLKAADGIRSVDVAPWPIRSEHDFLIQIHITRFEGVTLGRVGGGEAHLLASWEIIQPDDGSILARGITDHRSRDWPIDDYTGLVSRLDSGLLRLSQDVLACLRLLGTAAAPLEADSSRASTPRRAQLECPATR